MIPRPELASLGRRLDYLASGRSEPPREVAAAERRELWDALQLRRTRSETQVAELLDAREEPRRFHVRRRLLDLLFGAFGERSDAIMRLAIDKLGRDGLRDALIARTRVIDVLRFPPTIVDLITTFQRENTAANDASLAARMRTVTLLSRFYGTLTGPSPAASVASAAEKLHDLPLSPATLRVVLGHAVPLVRAYDASVAKPVLANLDKWLDELAQLRRAYVEEYRRSADLPDAGDTSLPETENDLYALALNAELNRIVNARLHADEEHDDRPLPEVVYFDKSLNEVAMPLIERAVDSWLTNPPSGPAGHLLPASGAKGHTPGRWPLAPLSGERVAEGRVRGCDEPHVLAEILRLATRIRSLRLLVVPLLDRLLFDATPRTDDVQIAAIRLAAAFSGGFRRDEARLETEFLYVQRGEGRYASLEDHVRAIFESDEGVRERLERIARDRAGRADAVRAEALRALLAIITAPQERVTLYELAAEGDPPLVRAFLEHVVADGTHSAFAFVERLHERARQLGIEPLFFEAVAATRHVESTQMLRRAGCEELIRRQGAEGVVNEMTAHRAIRHNIVESNDASERRERAIRQEAEHKHSAIRHESQASTARLQSEHANTEKHMAIALAAVEEARHIVTLEKHLHALAALLARVPPIRDELNALLQTVRKLADKHDELTERIDTAYREVQAIERQVRDDGAEIIRRRNAISSLGDDIGRLERRASQLRDRLRTLTSEQQGEIRSAQSEVAACDSRIRSARTEIDSHGEAIAALVAKIAMDEMRIHQAENAIQALNDDIAKNERERETARRDAAVQQAIFDQLLRDIDALKEQIRSTENAIHHVHRTLDERVRTLEATRLRYAEIQRDHQIAAAREIRAADRERQRYIELSSRIAELESLNAQLLATINANRERTAHELATIDMEARAAEAERRGRLRLRQSVQLNVDLLLSIVKAHIEPGPEARNVIARMESAR